MKLDPAAREKALDRLAIHTRVRRAAACLLGAVALAGTSTLLTPAAAPARGRHARVRSGEEAAPAPAEESTDGASRRRERRADRRGGCEVAISEVTPNRLSVGETTTVVGSVTCADDTEAGEQTVTIHEHTAGTHGSSVVGIVSTESNGAFRFTSGPLEADSSFYASCDGARSERALVRVTPLITIGYLPATTPTSLPSLPLRGHRAVPTALTFTGTVTPAQVGARVVLQRARANGREHWRRIGVGEVRADGSYAITYAFSQAGETDIRAVVHARGFPASASAPISYDITREQNLTLSVQPLTDPLASGLNAQVSANTVAVGEALTFSGAVAPAYAGQPVYLEREARTGVSFHVVQVGQVNIAASFSIQATALAPGTQVYRIKLPGGPHEPALTSQSFTVQVSAASALT